MAQEPLLRIYDAPKGPHVYFADIRIHHWMAGLVTATIGVFGLIFDKNKKRRGVYLVLCFAGSIAFLDDFEDFVSFVEDAYMHT